MKKIYKYIIVFAMLMIGMLIHCNNVEASTVTLTKSKTVNQGESVTITASVTSGSWNLVLEGAGQSKKLVGNTETEANETASTSITFTASNVGTYKFTLKGDVTDYVTDLTEDINQETIITVKAPEPPKQEDNTNQGGTTNPPANDNNNNTSNGSGTSGNNTSTGNGTSNNTGSSGSGSGTTNQQPEQKPEQKPVEKPAEKSSNNKLKNLGIRPNDFSGFKANTTKYNVSVPNDVSEVEVYAEAQDSKATISGTGKMQLQVGSNQAKVVCTAEDGTTKTYVINITRKEVEKTVEEPPVQEEPEVVEEPEETEPEEEEKEELPQVIMGLSKLEAIGKTAEGKDVQIELSPAFDENTQEYVMAVPLSVVDIVINAVAVDGDAKIEVMGNKNLVEGENIITVIVKIGENTKVYEIKVNKVAVEESFLSQELIMQLAVIAAVITIIIVAIIAIIIMIAKNSKKEKPAPRRAMSSEEIINGILEREAQQAKDENKTE